VLKDTNNGEDETSFSEAYRSQILNKDDDIEEESSKNLIVILVLVIIVVALGIFGYSYLSKNNQTEVVKKESIKEESIKEEPTTEEEVIEPPESMMLNNISELMDEEEGSNSTEQNKSSDSIKIEMEKETTPKEKKTSKQKGEDTYLEQLAELSKEIDGEK
jgi:uncharacterized protein HemX